MWRSPPTGADALLHPAGKFQYLQPLGQSLLLIPLVQRLFQALQPAVLHQENLVFLFYRPLPEIPLPKFWLGPAHLAK